MSYIASVLITHVTVCSIEMNRSYFLYHYRIIAKIHGLHDAVEELCDKSEDLEQKENLFTEKMDQICNKFKQVRNS